MIGSQTFREPERLANLKQSSLLFVSACHACNVPDRPNLAEFSFHLRGRPRPVDPSLDAAIVEVHYRIARLSGLF